VLSSVGLQVPRIFVIKSKENSGRPMLIGHVIFFPRELDAAALTLSDLVFRDEILLVGLDVL